jgi:hypothetical protein
MFKGILPVFAACAIGGMCTTAEVSAHPGRSGSPGQAYVRAGSGDLRLGVEVEGAVYREGENPSFRISFRNLGRENLLLNGGSLLGNGQEVWSAVACEFRARDGQRWPLSLHWGVAMVSGRIYFLGLPLRPGASYTIAVTPRDYFVGKGEHLRSGNYGLTCTYTGAQSPYRDSTQLPPCWEGIATSHAVEVEVRPSKPETAVVGELIRQGGKTLANHRLQPAAPGAGDEAPRLKRRR